MCIAISHLKEIACSILRELLVHGKVRITLHSNDLFSICLSIWIGTWLGWGYALVLLVSLEPSAEAARHWLGGGHSVNSVHCPPHPPAQHGQLQTLWNEWRRLSQMWLWGITPISEGLCERMVR